MVSFIVFYGQIVDDVRKLQNVLQKYLSAIN